MVGIEDIVLKQQGGISLHFSNHRIMRRNRTYSHNWVVVKEEDNKQDNLRFGFWNPVDFMSCSNEEFSLPNIDVASNSEMKNTDMIIARN